MSSAWAKVTELVLKLLAALGIYRAGGKAVEARQDRNTLKKIEEINEARADNRALTDEQLRAKLLGDIKRKR